MTTTNQTRRNPLALRNTDSVALASQPRGPTTLLYAQIRTDGGTQMRAAIDEVTADEYAQEVRQGAVFPPVVVFYDGSDHWLGDGFHRVRAYFLVHGEKAKIPCEVRPGTRRDAVLCAAGANAVHGLRRTNADKRRAVETLLRDEEWMKWSNREIARRCHVDEKTVRNLRDALTAENPQSDGHFAADDLSMHAQFTAENPQSQGAQTAEYAQTNAGFTADFPQSESDPADAQAQTNGALTAENPQSQRTYVTRHGTVATMNVSGQQQAAQTRQTARQPAAIIVEVAQPSSAVKADHPGSGAALHPSLNGKTQVESETAATRQVRIDELLTLYRAVVSSLGEYGALTGRHTHTPAVRRALEPLIEELKQNRAASEGRSG